MSQGIHRYYYRPLPYFIPRLPFDQLSFQSCNPNSFPSILQIVFLSSIGYFLKPLFSYSSIYPQTNLAQAARIWLKVLLSPLFPVQILPPRLCLGPDLLETGGEAVAPREIPMRLVEILSRHREMQDGEGRLGRD